MGLIHRGREVVCGTDRLRDGVRLWVLLTMGEGESSGIDTTLGAMELTQHGRRKCMAVGLTHETRKRVTRSVG